MFELEERYVQMAASFIAVGKSTYPADRRADTAGWQSLSSGFCVACAWLAAWLTYDLWWVLLLLAERGRCGGW